MLTKQLWKVFAHKESHHQLMVVPILSRTGENGTIDTFQHHRQRNSKANVGKSATSKANAIPIFTLFFNGNYVQTQWQWAWTLNRNIECEQLLILFCFPISSPCSHLVAFSLSSRAIRSQISNTSFNDFDAMTSLYGRVSEVGEKTANDFYSSDDNTISNSFSLFH